MKIRTTASIAPFRRSQLLARFLFSFVILAGSIFSLSADALAQSLTVGTDSALPGNDVDIAINFTAGATDISTIQLDLTFSGALSYVSTTTGSAASNAGKSASGSTIAGGVRVLVFGLNQNAVGSGAIAVVRLHIASGTAPGVLPISIGGISASDPLGNAVSLGGSSGSVTVNGTPDNTNPSITITSPTSGSSYTSSSASLNISGTASDNVGVTTVTWSNDRGGSGTASGTTNWSVSGISLQSGTNVITVTAKDAANNTGTDTLTVTYNPSDTINPSITITSPTSGSSYTSSSASLNISGTASDNVGVTTVTWSNNRGGSGTASGTTNWSVSGISLQSGTNVITVTAKDAANNTGTDTLTVTYESEEQDTTPPSIRAVKVSHTTHSEATVRWDTDEPATSQVEYGDRPPYERLTTLQTNLVTNHIHVLRGLVPSTSYRFRVVSKDQTGNESRSAEFAFETLEESTDSSEIQARLAFPLLTNAAPFVRSFDSQRFTGLALINLENQSATLNITARDSRGQIIDGDLLSNPVVRRLRSREQIPLLDVELFGEGIFSQSAPAWGLIESTVNNLNGFFLLFKSDLSTLDGTDLARSPISSFVLPTLERDGSSRLHVANPNPELATLTFDLVDASGRVIDAATRQVEGNGALIFDIEDEVFPGHQDMPAHYLSIVADRGVFPFALLGREGVHLKALYGQETSKGSTSLYSPQFVAGGPWHTSLSVVNLDTFSSVLTLRLIDEHGRVLATRILTISPHGKTQLDDVGFFDLEPSNAEPLQGYVEIISDGARLTGAVVFGAPPGGQFFAALPLIARTARSFLFSHVASDSTYFTGLALLNPNNRDATVYLDLFEPNGHLLFSSSMRILARSRESKVLRQIFPSLAEQGRSSGYLKVRSDLPLAGFSLFGTLDLRALSAIPAQPDP